MEPDLITAEELGCRLRLKPNTLIAWASQGRIPARRHSSEVFRFSPPEVSEAEATAEANACSSLRAADLNRPVPDQTKGGA